MNNITKTTTLLIISLLVLKLGQSQSAEQLKKKEHIMEIAKEMDVFEHIDFTNYYFENDTSLDSWITFFTIVKADKEMEKANDYEQNTILKNWESHIEKTNRKDVSKEFVQKSFKEFEIKAKKLNEEYKLAVNKIKEKYNYKEHKKKFNDQFFITNEIKE